MVVIYALRVVHWTGDQLSIDIVMADPPVNPPSLCRHGIHISTAYSPIFMKSQAKFWTVGRNAMEENWPLLAERPGADGGRDDWQRLPKAPFLSIGPSAVTISDHLVVLFAALPLQLLEAERKCSLQA